MSLKLPKLLYGITVPQSLVMKLVAYFGVEKVIKIEVLRGRVKELEWTRQG